MRAREFVEERSRAELADLAGELGIELAQFTAGRACRATSRCQNWASARPFKMAREL